MSSHTVSDSAPHEIGVRMALGARRVGILTLVLRQGMVLTMVGLVFGAVAAVALNRVMAGLLYGVTGTDPVTYIGIAAMVISVAGIACLVPARRASRVNAVIALRSE